MYNDNDNDNANDNDHDDYNNTNRSYKVVYHSLKFVCIVGLLTSVSFVLCQSLLPEVLLRFLVELLETNVTQVLCIVRVYRPRR